MKKVLFVVIIAAVASSMSAQVINRGESPIGILLTAETGFVDILSHRITIGESGTTFDYVNEGGQEILFPFSRFTSELELGPRHTVVFLLQPLKIETAVRFDEAVTVDGVVFAADQGVEVSYGFPFYRISYLFDLLASSRTWAEVGLSLQLRNATLRFESTNGELLTISQDLGPVPIIKLRAGHRFDARVPGLFAELEADGFAASSAFFNGADFEFSGSIFDVSARAGFSPQPGLEVFANLRALGGGASGTRPSEDRRFWSQSRSGYTDNFLTSWSLTLGARIR